jgi:hypothetical protein
VHGRGSIPGRDKILYSTASKSNLGPIQSPVQWVMEALSPGLMWPGYEADHSPPSSAEVKNIGAIPPLPHTSSWRDS